MPRLYRVEKDRIPTKDEIKHVLSYGNIKDRAVTLFKLSSGCRDQTIAALNLGDLDFEMFPDVAVVKVRAEITKDRVEHVTFITPEAITVLRRYLDLRRRKGEDLGPDAPIFTYMGKRQLPPSFSQRWRRLLKKSGKGEKKRLRYDIHFHVLRKFFRTWLDTAGVGSAFRERLMGHKGEGYSDAYFKPNIESLLSEYRKAIPHLTLAPPKIIISPLELKFNSLLVDIAMTCGPDSKLYKDTERARNEINTEKALNNLLKSVSENQEYQNARRSKWAHLERTKTNNPENNNYIYKEIPEEKLIEYLNKGYEHVKDRQNGTSIVRKPKP